MSDSESDYSSITDEETQEEDLRQLNAVLEKERHYPIDLSCRSTSDSRIPWTDHQEYDKIRTALSLNKQTEEKLQRLEKVLITRLRECRQRLSEIHRTSINQKSDKAQPFRSLFCGKPYFKDRDFFPPPDNEDTLTMVKSGMFDYSDAACLSGWTVKDKSDFIQQIEKFSHKIRKDELESKLSELRRKSKKQDSKSIQNEILAVQKKIENVKKVPLNVDLVLPLDKEYDWDAIANALNYRHSPEEYQSLWKLFLHPKINKKNWDKAEHTRLHEIAIANQLQDWNKIATELNTGRTGYQCFVYYRTNMSNSLIGQKWSKEEEEYLRRLIDYYREGNYIPWGKVAASMENRTKIQIYNKYARLMEMRKGRFLPEEDSVLLTGVDKFGPVFKKIAKYIPGRSAAQLRNRYNVLNTSTRTSVVWTVEEDKKLIQLMANQDITQYINYANLTSFFPDKDRAQLRARYVTLVKWMKKHPNKDILSAPRRGARRLIHGKGEGDMNLAVENLKKRIKSEIETKRYKKITKDSPEDVIEHGIIATLVTESVRDEQAKKLNTDEDELGAFMPSQPKINEANLRKLLILLKAKINKQYFESSTSALKFPRLKQPDNESYTVKVKSYSKKAATNTLTVGGQINPPDIFGNNTLTTNEYVLPPNYSTITGCRKLMALASNGAQKCKSLSLHQFTHRNTLVKEQVHIFMERFNTLFLWPLLLSNESPITKKVDRVEVKEKHVKWRELLAVPVSCVIPSTPTCIVHESIDLPSTSSEKTSIVEPKAGMIDDDYEFINDYEGAMEDTDNDE